MYYMYVCIHAYVHMYVHMHLYILYVHTVAVHTVFYQLVATVTLI